MACRWGWGQVPAQVLHLFTEEANADPSRKASLCGEGALQAGLGWFPAILGPAVSSKGAGCLRAISLQQRHGGKEGCRVKACQTGRAGIRSRPGRRLCVLGVTRCAKPFGKSVLGFSTEVRLLCASVFLLQNGEIHPPCLMGWSESIKLQGFQGTVFKVGV